MSARIDHYAEMLDALELAKKSTNADVSRNAALLAQVHATAYAAEQARIGNLIAYVAKWTDEEVLDVDTEIREGLGLSSPPPEVEHIVKQEIPWPAYAEADYLLSRFVCTCGWQGGIFKDTKATRSELYLAQREANAHELAALS